MATTQSVTGSTRTLEDYQNSQRVANQTLDKDAFLQLLIEQMANQDPLNPASDTEYISQLAQFSMLEELQSLNDTMTQTQLYSLVGKYVFVNSINSESGEQELVYGKVEGVIKQNGIDYLIIGDKQYQLSDLVGIASVEETQTVTDTVTNSTGLLGRTISALLNEETITGTVSKLFSRDGIVYALVGEQEIPVSSITEIS
jgi:flagellar basal-body rod modification protein FlgD